MRWYLLSTTRPSKESSRWLRTWRSKIWAWVCWTSTLSSKGNWTRSTSDWMFDQLAEPLADRSWLSFMIKHSSLKFPKDCQNKNVFRTFIYLGSDQTSANMIYRRCLQVSFSENCKYFLSFLNVHQTPIFITVRVKCATKWAEASDMSFQQVNCKSLMDSSCICIFREQMLVTLQVSLSSGINCWNNSFSFMNSVVKGTSHLLK